MIAPSRILHLYICMNTNTQYAKLLISALSQAHNQHNQEKKRSNFRLFPAIKKFSMLSTHK